MTAHLHLNERAAKGNSPISPTIQPPSSTMNNMSPIKSNIDSLSILLRLISALAATLLVSAHGQAATISYQQGFANPFTSNYQGTDDAWIRPGSPTLNYGNSSVYVSNNGIRGLLRFDLTSFAGQYSQINSVTLQLQVNTVVGSVENGEIQARSILPANAGWVEGTAFNTAQAGSSCWNYRQASTLPWAGSPGLSTPGVDYDDTLLGSLSYSGLGVYSMSLVGTPAQLTALIDSWSASASNPGLLLTEGNPLRDGDTRIYSSEVSAAFAATRPKLTIEYTAVPEPSTLILLAIAGLLGLLAWRRK